MGKHKKIDLENPESIVVLIEKLKKSQLEMITGETEDNEMIIAQLVDNSEAKIKVVVMKDDNKNKISYFNEFGTCIEELYKKDEL